jgi:EmrB/QacA subfamily drug resistance transporter
VVSTALPKIIGSLHGSQTQYTWVITATLLTATATTPLWGKLADLFDKKTLVQISTIVFVAGSIAAGFSQGAGQLIAARAVQGIGMGGLQSLVQISIAAMISPRERGRYAGYQSSATALATIGGPLLGGLIVDTSWLGWRWCFYIAIPISVIALTLLQYTLRLPTIARASVKIDYVGAALIAAGVSVLLIWISFVDSSFDWVSWPSAVMVGGSVVLLALAVAVETRALEPIVPLDIVKQPAVALAILGSLAAGTAMYGSSVFLSQYFQLARGHSPVQAGLLTIPMMAGILISSIIAGPLLTKIGSIKPFLLTGTILLTVGFAGLSQIDENTPLIFICTAMLLNGAGIGMTVQNFVLLVQNAVALKDIGAATSTVSFFRSLGGTIGVSVLGAVLARQVSSGFTRDLSAAGLPSPGGASAGSSLQNPNLPPAVREIIQSVYGDATGHIFLISAAVALVGVLAVVLLKPVSLRTSLDLPATLREAVVATEIADGAPAAEPVPER